MFWVTPLHDHHPVLNGLHHDCQAHCACGRGAIYEFALPWSLHFESLGSRMQRRGFLRCRRRRVPAGAADRRRAAGGAGVGAGMARAADAAAGVREVLAAGEDWRGCHVYLLHATRVSRDSRHGVTRQSTVVAWRRESA